MAYDIGPRIGVDGEAEFRKEIKQITDNIKTLGTELKVVASAADLEGESIESLSSKNDILNQTIAELEKRLSAQQEMLDKAAAKYGEADSKTLGWQRAVNSTQTELNKLKSQVQQNEKAMDSLGSETDDAGDAMDDLGDAADNSGGKLDAMTVALGSLISAGIQAAISAVVDLASQIWNLDEATEEYRESQARLTAAYENSGFSANTAKSAYEELYSIMGETDTAVEAAQQISLLADSEKDVEKWSRLAAGVVGQFGDALQPETFFESANETLKLGEATGAYTQMLDGAGINVEEFNAQLASCNTEQEKQAFLLETAESILGGAGEAYRNYAGDIISANEAQTKINESLGSLGGTISQLKTAALSEFAPGISALIEGFNGLLTGAQGAQEQFSAAITGLINTAVGMLPEFLNFGIQLLGNIVLGIAQAIPSLIEAVPQIVQSFVTALQGLWPELVSVGSELLTKATDGILQYIPEMLTRLPDVITAILDFLTENLPSILEKGIDFLGEFASGIIDAVPDMVAKLPEVITAFVNFISKNLPTIAKNGVELLLKLASGIISAIPQLVKVLPQIISAIVNGITSLMGSIINVGKSIVSGIWQGIQNMATWIKNKVTGFFSGIVNGVKGLLGINSPSKVFAGIGENMADGLGVGWDDEMGAVQRQINRSMSDLLPDTSASVNVSGASGAAGGYTDIGAAITNALSGAVVYMDGKKVGKLITQTQNRTIRANGLVPTI